jgi:hypothetical protein
LQGLYDYAPQLNVGNGNRGGGGSANRGNIQGGRGDSKRSSVPQYHQVSDLANKDAVQKPRAQAWLRRANRLIPALRSRRRHFKTASDTDIMAPMKKRTVSKTERLSRRNITDLMNWIERGESGKELGQGKESWTG